MENINKIQIVPDEVYEIGADKAPVIPEWSVKDDTTLLQKVKALAHSTFDRSKFTVVGSPNITDDGIASGFSGSNYLTKNLDFSGASDWEIQFKFTTGSDITTTQRIIDRERNTGVNTILIQIQNSKCVLALNVDNTEVINFNNSSFNVTTNTTYIIKVGYTGTSYYCKYNTGGNDITIVTVVSDKKWSDSRLHYIGTGTVPSTQYFKGSIDLKQFSITVDGIEGFSGNKTGIDTVKSDDYTVVGIPTISAEGVASGFSISNYLTAPSLNTSGVKELILEAEFTAPTSQPSSYSDGYEPLLQVNEVMLSITFKSGYFNTNGLIFRQGSFVIGQTNLPYDGSKYIIQVVCDLVNNSYYCRSKKISENNWSQYHQAQANPYVVGSSNARVLIGAFKDYNGTVSRAFLSSFIDLNTVKVYADGNLVYQPCLKIPYTESKTGLKITDSIYRDRVKDLFEQEGYNIYYTLGEDDFTLPSNKPNDIVKYKANGLTVAEQRADQTLTIRGACESGTDVNLPMDFFDADSYAVFGVATTGTNTASKFTPAADGNYIAIGKGKV